VSAGEPAALVDAALRRMNEGWPQPSQSEARELDVVRVMLDGSDDLRRACVLELAERSTDGRYLGELAELFQRGARPKAFLGLEQAGFYADASIVDLLSVVARKRLPLSGADLERLLTSLWEAKTSRHYRSTAVRALSRQIEQAHAELSEAERARLAPLLGRLADENKDAATVTRLRKLLAGSRQLPLELIGEGSDVASRVRAAFERSGEAHDGLAAALDLLSGFPASGRPPRKWETGAGRVREALADPRGIVASILDAALEAEDVEKVHVYENGRRFVQTLFVERGTESFLCGVAALASGVADAAILLQLRRLAAKSVIVIGGQFGNPRSLRLANACAQAIADAGAPASITELLALERSVRHGTLLKQIRKAIDSLAAAQGLTREELLERAVEDHGLGADGTREVRLARGSARVETDARAATLAYLDEAGTRKKSFPADVKESDAETLATLRDELKQIRKTIAGERHRLDRLLAFDRRWSLSDWRALYLDHPVTGRLTRTLVWGFHGPDGADTVGIPTEGAAVVTSAGEDVRVPEAAEVRLWHPVHATASELHAWRLHLLEQLIVQPFKQAFRELYVLEAVERADLYSNRFAGHVFRQVQARALMKGRGWQPVPVAWWDDGIDQGVARRTFEPFGIRAEFFFDPILDFGPETSDLYPYCTSDQVRFFDADDEAIALDDVPLLVFTETMRDVDLFVGVTSIGADPEWLDRGEGRRFESYWRRFNFGELGQPAHVRRIVLEELLPRLPIAGRCTLDGRYLVVRGDLRTYRIHLGSGNVLMSPDDEYLFMLAVRDRRADKLFLPFDDDPVLALILSKAFLLSDDSRITDETILRQIRGS
jgi:hypothetical protein